VWRDLLALACELYILSHETVTANVCDRAQMCVLHWACNLTVPCSSLFAVLSEVHRHIGGNYLGSASFADRVLVPSTDENSFDLDSGNRALHFRANLAHKYTRPVEKFLSLHPVTFHWSPFVSCSV